MIRIAALNEESRSSGSEDDNEPTVTKEAQETIAVSEYVRALKLKTDNCKEDACKLFLELLDTEVLHNVSNEKKDKLFSVKYNCYKNLGFIYIETGDSDMALKYLLDAYELDDTDVFTMNKLGQLALRMKKYEISLISFEKCLVQNPNHWPSLDGILKILCLKENYCEAYGWALLCYNKDKTYELAVNVILEVRSKFQSMGLDYIENCFKIKFTDFNLKRTNTASVFPDYVEHMEPEEIQPNFSEFKLNELTWMSTGQFIIDLYTAFEDNGWGKHTIMSFSDLISGASVPDDNNQQCAAENEPQRENVDDVASNAPTPTPTVDNISDEDKENSNSNEGAKCSSSADHKAILSADGSADDSDATKQNDVNGKSKQSRRRGSDLKFLEQWGWHKTKKAPVQRRKNVEQNDGESTINGILRRILSKHFEQNFDEEPVFQNESIDCNTPDPTENLSVSQLLEVTSDEFQIATQNLFDEFIAEVKNGNFSIITLVLKWLKYVSLFWSQTMPKDLLDIYLKLYPCYLNHFDLCTWNLLDKNDFKAAFRMALFYLELYHDRCTSRHGQEINDQWLRLYHHIIFQSGFFEVSNDEDLIVFAESRIRVLWLQFCLNCVGFGLIVTVSNSFAQVDELIKERPTPFTLTFPNQKHNKKIDLDTCKELEKTFERTISLHSVNKLYHEKSFNQLITILKNTILTQATRKLDDYDSPVRLSTQIEVFLECLWNNESFEDCLVWSEKFLKYAADTYLAAPSDTFRQTEWGDLVTYILTYIEALVNQESNEIFVCLDKFYSRLIQNLSKIVVNQLDVPYD
ncbi:hypothetical protein HA402_011903 [Bradysia odoriphaga]|nr:hypothetical protein HA402_011903 [Bradysia odoriphaga]